MPTRVPRAHLLVAALLTSATLLAASSFAADPAPTPARQPWQVITTPTVAEAAASFANPPPEYSAIHWAIWGGQQSKDRIAADIQHIHDNGGGVYMINNSRGLSPAYFTPEYLDLVKFTVEKCKQVGLKVWIEGDAGYPDGFAGGMISSQVPQLGMQGIVPDARYSIPAGQSLKIQLPPDTLGIIASPEPAAEAQTPAPAQNATDIPLPPDGNLKYTCPSGGSLDVHFVGSPGEPRFSLVPGQTLTLPVPPGTTRIEAAPRARGPAGPRNAEAKQEILPLPADGNATVTAPADSALSLTLVRHVYRSSPTRFTNRADGTNDKDSLYSLIDYLDPAATDAYLHIIYDKYQEIVGDEFGKTILGFRGDETDFTGIAPWTPKLLETFKQEKGYDLAPYIPQFFEANPSEDARRAKADYWDVWSGMFRDNFYKRMQAWCEKRGMQFMVHLNHEELQVNPRGEDLIKNEGSFFRDMRYVGVPGVDNLSQIGPGIIADFPKLAASTAHLYGRPLVWDEEGGATGRSGKFVVDYQLVRGINFMNIRGMQAAPNPTDLQSPGDATGHYVSRAEHLLALGRPAARIALFHATDTYWLGGAEAVDADATQLKLVTQLLQHQLDFDHIDSDTLGASQIMASLSGAARDALLTNASGSGYEAVIIPSCTVIQKPVLEKLRTFSQAGGKVIFLGKTPTMVIDKTFLHPESAAPDLSFATLLEPTPELTDKVLAALPAPDVKLDQPCPPITYIHRSLKDGDVYFFFNESDQPQSRNVTLAAAGNPQWWDPATGQILPLANFSHTANSTTLPLTLQGQESRLIVLAPQAPGNASAAAAAPLNIPLDGDWTITLADKSLTSPLKSWQDLNLEPAAAPVHYHKTFTSPADLPKDQPLFLDLGTVNEIARVTLNGHALPPRSWSPFLWDITSALTPGENTLDIDVQIPAAQGFGRGNFGGAPGGTRAGRGGRGNRAGAPNPASAPAAATPEPAPPTVTRARGGGSLVRTATSGLLGPVRLTTQ